MNKKTFFTLMIFILIFSCGKKSDPEYNKLQKKNELQTFVTNIT